MNWRVQAPVIKPLSVNLVDTGANRTYLHYEYGLRRNKGALGRVDNSNDIQSEPLT